jgi:RimJ/RimL family protein N-acetyltransferase
VARPLHLVRRWLPGELPVWPVPAGIELRQLTDADAENLRLLFWSAFGSAGEDGHASADTARDEARDNLAGKWGPVIWDASVVATSPQRAVAASVVVRDDAHQMLPLLAFLVTSPEHQRYGIGQSILTATLRRMDALGIHELHLAVSAGNTPADSTAGWGSPPPLPAARPRDDCEDEVGVGVLDGVGGAIALGGPTTLLPSRAPGDLAGSVSAHLGFCFDAAVI